MICKKCGSTLEQRERFCPHCGSYFIDASEPDDSDIWKGVILSDGTLADSAAITRVNSSKKPVSDVSSVVWGVISIVSASMLAFFNLLILLYDSSFFAMAIPQFIFTLVAFRGCKGTRQKKIALIIFGAAILVLFGYIVI